VVFSTLQLVERLLWVVLMWVPLYGVLKCLVLGWLVMPRFLGARLLYTAFIRKGLYVVADALKEIPAFEEIVKPFVGGAGGKGEGGVRRTVAAAVSHSVAGNEKRDG
jgi:hypothetical protein